MLAIEIDGDTHAGQKQYDEDRTKNLNKFGVEVIRYTNAEVLNNLEGVYQDLHKRISARKPPKSLKPLIKGDFFSPCCRGTHPWHFLISSCVLYRSALHLIDPLNLSIQREPIEKELP